MPQTKVRAHKRKTKKGSTVVKQHQRSVRGKKHNLTTKEKRIIRTKKFVDKLKKREDLEERFELDDRYMFYNEDLNIYYDIMKDGSGYFVETIGVNITESSRDFSYLDESFFFREEPPIEMIEENVEYYRKNNKYKHGAFITFMRDNEVEPSLDESHELVQSTRKLRRKEGTHTKI